MNVCEWFIVHVLPLFCDISKLETVYFAGVPMSVFLADCITAIFTLVVSVCAVNLLIVLPYKWAKYLLSGGRKKKL